MDCLPFNSMCKKLNIECSILVICPIAIHQSLILLRDKTSLSNNDSNEPPHALSRFVLQCISTDTH